MKTRTPRVVIGEDETLLREGLMLVLGQGGFDVVATAGDAPALIRAVRMHEPALVVTDIRMPPGHADEGLRAALEIRGALPGTAIVVLSHHLQREVALTLVTDSPAGTGYLLKQRIGDVATFCADLRSVCEGRTVLDSDVVTLLVSRSKPGTLARLTERQREVLALMAEGRSNAFIARKLWITERSVVQHASNIYDQLGLPVSEDDHRRVLAVLRYLAREPA